MDERNENKEFFATAYRTGSDVWTHIPYHKTAMSLIPQLPASSMVLDLGSGRGVWMRKLISMGFRVIGIDYVQDIVDIANKDLKLENLTEQARFVHGDVRDLPFTDKSFDLVTSIGVLQHLHDADWETYISEACRVLKPGAYMLDVSLSRETTKFLDHNPKSAQSGMFAKFGLTYYFFTESELQNLFKNQFVIAKQMVRFFPTRTEPGDGIAMVFTLLQRK